MANDIDMWQDIQCYAEKPDTEKIAKDLFSCYQKRYIEGDGQQADKLKEEFIKRYNFWDNWY